MSYVLFRLFAGILPGMRRRPVELSDAFALVVERLRKQKGLSRAALATRAGLHQTYLGLLERGKRAPNLDTAQAVARSLRIPLSKLIAKAERKQRRKPAP